MKINQEKNTEIIIHQGKLSVYVDGNKIMENYVGDNLPYVLGIMMGVLRNKGVIV